MTTQMAEYDFKYMTNAERIELYRELSKKSDKLFREKNFKERNKLCAPITALNKLIDWGFSAGEEVLTYGTGDRRIKGRIIKHVEDNRFLVRKETGGEEIHPGCFFMKVPVEDEVKVELTAVVEAQFEQLALF